MAPFDIRGDVSGDLRLLLRRIPGARSVRLPSPSRIFVAGRTGSRLGRRPPRSALDQRASADRRPDLSYFGRRSAARPTCAGALLAPQPSWSVLAVPAGGDRLLQTTVDVGTVAVAAGGRACTCQLLSRDRRCPCACLDCAVGDLSVMFAAWINRASDGAASKVSEGVLLLLL